MSRFTDTLRALATERSDQAEDGIPGSQEDLERLPRLIEIAERTEEAT